MNLDDLDFGKVYDIDLDNFDFDECYEFIMDDISARECSILRSTQDYIIKKYGIDFKGVSRDPLCRKIEKTIIQIIKMEERPEYLKIIDDYLNRVRSRA